MPSRQQRSREDANAGQFADLGFHDLETMSQYYEGWMHGLTKLNAETSRFIKQRLEEDFQMPARLAKCQTPVDVYEAQAAFVEQAFSDYVEEVQKLGALLTDTVGDGTADQFGRKPGRRTNSR